MRAGVLALLVFIGCSGPRSEPTEKSAGVDRATNDAQEHLAEILSEPVPELRVLAATIRKAGVSPKGTVTWDNHKVEYSADLCNHPSRQVPCCVEIVVPSAINMVNRQSAALKAWLELEPDPLLGAKLNFLQDAERAITFGRAVSDLGYWTTQIEHSSSDAGSVFTIQFRPDDGTLWDGHVPTRISEKQLNNLFSNKWLSNESETIRYWRNSSFDSIEDQASVYCDSWKTMGAFNHDGILLSMEKIDEQHLVKINYDAADTSEVIRVIDDETLAIFLRASKFWLVFSKKVEH